MVDSASKEDPVYHWDPKKAKSNHQKHGVYFSDAELVLEDDMAITITEKFTDENRFVTIGMDAFGNILVVVYTYRDDEVRIISARKATPRERKKYEAKR